MPKSSPSINPIAIEVIELDRPPGLPPANRSGRSGSRRADWRWVIGGAMLLIAALALFPGDDRSTAQPQTGALPEPAVATTQPAAREVLVSVTSGETFPLLTVSGLDGFASLTPPVEFGDRFWIVGNPPRPTDRAIVLSSPDGTRWSPVTEIVPGAHALRIDDLVVFDGQLLAAGTVGTEVGKPYMPLMPGGLTVWRSSDGTSWNAESILADTFDTEYWGIALTVSDGIALINAGSQGIGPDPQALAEIPAELEPALERGDLSIWRNGGELMVVALPGIRVFRMTTGGDYEDYLWKPRMFRSNPDGDWLEVGLEPEWLDNVVAAPGGGFLATKDGTTFTSAFGETWRPNSSVPPAFYAQWGDAVVGTVYGWPSYWLGDSDGFTRIQFPEEVSGDWASLIGGAGGLAGVSSQYQTSTADATITAGRYTLSLIGGRGLRIEDAAGEATYTHYGTGTYDPDTGLLTVVEEGRSFTFPIDGLKRLWQPTETYRSDVYIAADGLHWARSQSGLIGDWVTVLGPIGHSFLLASNHYDPSTGQNVEVTVTLTGPVS